MASAGSKIARHCSPPMREGGRSAAAAAAAHALAAAAAAAAAGRGAATKRAPNAPQHRTRRCACKRSAIGCKKWAALVLSARAQGLARKNLQRYFVTRSRWAQDREETGALKGTHVVVAMSSLKPICTLRFPTAISEECICFKQNLLSSPQPT